MAGRMLAIAPHSCHMLLRENCPAAQQPYSTAVRCHPKRCPSSETHLHRGHAVHVHRIGAPARAGRQAVDGHLPAMLGRCRRVKRSWCQGTLGGVAVERPCCSHTAQPAGQTLFRPGSLSAFSLPSAHPTPNTPRPLPRPLPAHSPEGQALPGQAHVLLALLELEVWVVQAAGALAEVQLLHRRVVPAWVERQGGDAGHITQMSLAGCSQLRKQPAQNRPEAARCLQ